MRKGGRRKLTCLISTSLMKSGDFFGLVVDFFGVTSIRVYRLFPSRRTCQNTAHSDVLGNSNPAANCSEKIEWKRYNIESILVQLSFVVHVEEIRFCVELIEKALDAPHINFLIHLATKVALGRSKYSFYRDKNEETNRNSRAHGAKLDTVDVVVGLGIAKVTNLDFDFVKFFLQKDFWKIKMKAYLLILQ